MTVAALPDRDDGMDRYRGYVQTADVLMREHFPPVEYAVPGVIPEGYVVLAGPPKVGKSWLVLAILLAIALGSRVLGTIWAQDPRPVLYLALEDSRRRMQRRLAHLGVDPDSGPALFHFATGDVPMSEVIDVAATFLRDHAHERPVVCIDTLAMIMRPAAPGQGAYERDYAMGTRLKELARLADGCTVIAVHHTRKAAADDWMDGVSGTNGVNGAADATLVVHRKRGADSGRLSITGRDIERDGTLAMTCDGMRWALDGDSVADAMARADVAEVVQGLGDRSADIVAYVTAHPGGVTPVDVAAGVHGLGNKDAGDYLRRLATAGRVRREGRGRYVPAVDADALSDGWGQ